jgi:hypothetical protein
MPSRKRAQGKERKAKKDQVELEQKASQDEANTEKTLTARRTERQERRDKFYQFVR